MMAEKNNTTCSICGSEYYACFSCKEAMNLHPWKLHCCSIDCYKTYQVVRGFSTGVYTKDEFKSKLQSIDLSNLDNYREHIKAIIKDALKEDAIVEPIVEIGLAEEEVVVEKPVVSRKRNYKINNETKTE
jgi:uncharacterized CHY-type Zn-finger protein